MKFYAKVLPDSLGRIMYRINKNMRKYAPSWAEFVDSPDKADVQVLDVIGTGSLDYLYKDKYILLQHCYLTTETADPNYWVPVFDKALLVTSYMDLYGITGRSSFNFIRIPCGIDPEVFYETESVVTNTIMSTGYVAITESIEEAYNAVVRAGGHMVNVGANFKFGNRLTHKENISDAEMRSLYNSSMYVIGLRKGEGFELPVVEGLMCGARGICYNKDHYKFWYGDLVEYIEEDPNGISSYSPYVEEQIYNILRKDFRAVTPIEKETVVKKFSWENIFAEFWKEVEKIV